MIFDSFAQQGSARGGASMADFLDWRARSRSFQSLDAFEINSFTNSRFTWTRDGEAEQLIGSVLHLHFLKLWVSGHSSVAHSRPAKINPAAPSR